jgi:uncharacterized protein YndB with AHSA1/START domain
MNPLEISLPPVAKAEMLIRRPVAQVYRAFVYPEVTSKFWFTHGSGPLDQGKVVQWMWAMYGFTIDVKPIDVQPNELIRIEWPGEPDPTIVEWRFKPHGAHATFVSITNSAFQGDGDQQLQQALGSVEGFTIVLAGAKAWLEHSLQLNLVADRFPEGLGG